MAIDSTTDGSNGMLNIIAKATQEDALSERINQINDQQKNQLEQYMYSLFENALELNAVYSGRGTHENQLQNNLVNLDRFGIRNITYNNVRSGLTFISRPHLNLSPLNLRQNRFMSLLNTFDNQSIPFMIRMLLDVPLSKEDNIKNDLLQNCPYFNPKSPWLTPLMNNLTDISGFPSQTIETANDAGGFFSESQSIAIGSDRNSKPFDLQVSFTEPLGGICMSILHFWLEYISCVTLGEMVAYPWQIDRQILNYTVSIYRFILDPSNQYIQDWSKCTGCFPVARPGGARFDISRTETFIEAAKNFSTTFKCNKYEESDPIILEEFNTLARRYWPALEYLQEEEINKTDNVGYISSRGLYRLENNPEDNYRGLPYITYTTKGPRIGYFVEEREANLRQRIDIEKNKQDIYDIISRNTNIINDALSSIGNTDDIMNMPIATDDIGNTRLTG